MAQEQTTIQQRKSPTKRIVLIVALILLLCLIAVCAIYLGDYYHADAAALEILQNPPSTVTILQTDTRIDFIPEKPAAGIIFYPGGKVQYEAYASLMAACAERGGLCVLLRMPFNLAVLDMNAADSVAGDYPEITDWYIGGHSLGGAMTGTYAAAHTEELRSLVLLAAYTTKDFSDSGLRVLSVYGSEDGVLNREAYAAVLENLPEGSVEIIIDGGCHAYFGSYGPQAGDGTPAIRREEQFRQTVDEIVELMNLRSSVENVSAA